MPEKFVFTYEHPFRSIVNHITKCLFCPFCEISTSCDVNVYLCSNGVYFWCTSCDMRCIVNDINKIRGDVSQMYPSFESNKISNIYKCDLMFITTVTTTFLSYYCGTIDADAVVKFSDSAVKYASEHKVEICSLPYDKKFNEENVFIRDYKLRPQISANQLQIAVNSYNLEKPSAAYPEGMTFHKNFILELKVLKGTREVLVLFDPRRTPWHKK